MPDLKKSRGKFFNKHRMPADRNFWLYYTDLVDKNSAFPVGYADRLRSFGPARSPGFVGWIPERSNCPEISGLMEGMIERIPDEWKATAKNLFVGRVVDGEVNAGAWSHRQAGIVEINLQYTYALFGYVVAFEHYANALRTLFDEIKVPSPDLESLAARLNGEGVVGPWSALDDHRGDWLDRNCLRGIDESFAKSILPEREDELAEIVGAAEEWIVSHEVAHHLLGHTASRRRYDRAYTVVRQTLEDVSLFDSLHALNDSQREEIFADTLAFMLVADAVQRAPTSPGLYRALFGSILALTAAAHVSDDWVELRPDGTHPGFVTRHRVLVGVASSLSSDCPRGPSGDHPMDLINQLAGFCSIPLNNWLARELPEIAKPMNISDAAKNYLDGVELMHELRSKSADYT